MHTGPNPAKPGLPNQTVENAEREDVEAVARTIANEIGPSYDDAYENKAEWVDDRGRRADINAPMKCDYRHAAQAAIDLLKSRGRYPRTDK